MHEAADDGADVEVLVPDEELSLVGAEREIARYHEAEVTQDEVATVREAVLEVGIHVQDAVAAEERDVGQESGFQGLNRRGGFRVSRELAREPPEQDARWSVC